MHFRKNRQNAESVLQVVEANATGRDPESVHARYSHGVIVIQSVAELRANQAGDHR
jgi:hypothetical protein